MLPGRAQEAVIPAACDGRNRPALPRYGGRGPRDGKRVEQREKARVCDLTHLPLQTLRGDAEAGETGGGAGRIVAARAQGFAEAGGGGHITPALVSLRQRHEQVYVPPAQ